MTTEPDPRKRLFCWKREKKYSIIKKGNDFIETRKIVPFKRGKSGMLFYKIRVQKGVKVMKFSEFIYKRIDLEETKKKIQEITEKLKHAQSVEEQVQAVYEMNDVKKEIATADSLVYIRYTINTKDEFYAKEREYNDHIGPMLEEEMQKYNKVLLATPFRKDLEDKLGKV